ncbi:MAG: rod shape-determining protein MreD [Gammaproteobacteria bacterium]|jgi:rod shape-determining protein MreD
MHHSFKGKWLIILTIFVALMLDVMPLPDWIVWLRPQWTLLVMIYWMMALPFYIGFFYAFCIGILLDLLNGTLLGEHAFAMLIVAYLIIKLYQLIRVYPMMQQTLIIFALVALYRAIIYIIQGMIGELPHTMVCWLTVFISTILWPWVFIILRDMRRKFCLTV